MKSLCEQININIAFNELKTWKVLKFTIKTYITQLKMHELKTWKVLKYWMLIMHQTKKWKWAKNLKSFEIAGELIFVGYNWNELKTWKVLKFWNLYQWRLSSSNELKTWKVLKSYSIIWNPIIFFNEL